MSTGEIEMSKCKSKICIIAIILSVMFLLSGCSASEELIEKSTSPSGKYTVEAYLMNPGATGDYSIKVYLQKVISKVLIYNKYHDYDADIKWLSDDVVVINSVTLDVSKGETYDWRNDENLE